VTDYTFRDLREAWIDYRTGDEAFDEYKDYVAADAAFHQAMSDHARRVLIQHQARPLNSPNCICGWRPTISLNDTEADRGQHLGHIAEILAGRAV
jgi:DNA-binding GntR family transcriptional regulator